MSEKIITLNEDAVKTELKDLVRKSVEETLNELLDNEAEELTGAGKYERSESRKGYRSGHYTRNLTTTSGNVKLSVPKLKGVPFETAIIERYRRRESSVEEALIEMCEAVHEVFPEAKYQRCTVHFYRNIMSSVPRNRLREVMMMLKAIHAQESKEAARKKAKEVYEKLREMKLNAAAKKLEGGIEETLTYMDFPS